uniref:RING-type E3 ubiquitin transferase n=1 Tax=Cacopsylla melanoneura TaxID=428564 RepID=A0A8D9BP54_9HEMI
MINIEVGLRVLRGPNWKWADEDGGEGGLGTVVAVKPTGHQVNVVSVIWDVGNKSSCYRVGSENAFDLRVYDSGPAGVRHEGIQCEACLSKCGAIIGSRYSCVDCNDVDLCGTCYHGDRHDLAHGFYRIDTPTSPPVVLPSRRLAQKIPIRGFSIGAKVTRGLNWEWDGQDGGPGKTGRIISIEDGKVGKSYRSIAKVLWSIGKENIYRIGSYGKVDLKCVGSGVPCTVYKTHLPVLGQEVSPGHIVFRRGDRVKVTTDATTLQHIQESSKGGWTPQLLRFLGQVGIVHRVTEQRLVRVRFDNCDNKWTFDPRVLSKVDPFLAGDFVYFIPDERSARENLKGHGEWIEAMASDLGDRGIVVKVYEDKDVRVGFRKNIWTLSPKCLELVKSNPLPDSACVEANYRDYLLPFLQHNPTHSPSNNSSVNNTPTHNGHTSFNTPTHHVNILPNNTPTPNMSNLPTHNTSPFKANSNNTPTHNAHRTYTPTHNVNILSNNTPTHIPSNLPTPSNVPLGEEALESPEDLVEVVENVMREVVRGNTAAVRDYLDEANSIVDCPVSGGKTLLHILSYQGCVEELTCLLSRGACVYYPDDAGDTGLHYAAFGNRPQAIETLIQHGAGIDFYNKLGHTPLHVAVFQNFPECVRVLLRHGCDVNIQDNNKDTPLHDAVAKGLDEIQLLLLSHPEVNLYLENSKGFNILNHAVLRGNLAVTEKILAMNGNLATVPKTSDGFTPLHVAAFNDHIDIVKLLVETFKVNVNSVDLKQRTPLMCAVGQGQSSVIHYLVSHGGGLSLDCQDVDGNGLLHFLFIKKSYYKTPISRERAPQIYEEYLSVGGPSNEHGILLAVFLFLVKRGAPLTQENGNKQKPLDLILEDTSLLNEILEHAQLYVTDLTENENDKIVTAISQIALDEKLLARRPSVQSVPVECAVCSELGVANVRLKPCNHAVACEECSSRMKKCIVCKAFVEARVTMDGRSVPGIERQDKSKIERVNYLESKISEIEELNTCTICMERCRNTIFLCGHGTCDVCAKTLKFCHMCRKLIEQRINVFL